MPVFYGDHVHHQASLALFLKFDKSIGCCGAQASAAMGIVGGGIYDAMLAHCAVKADAEAIYS